MPSSALSSVSTEGRVPEARYAADMRHEALVEAVAKALMDECYGAGSWDRIAHTPAGVGQVHGFKQQARAAIKVVQDWDLGV